MSDIVPRLSVVTLGVADVGRAQDFYRRLGFRRKLKATGDAIAFFQTGATILSLFPWDELAADALMLGEPRPQAFRGTTLAWMCKSAVEVDAALEHAVAAGGTLLKRGQHTSFGGYSGYFADPDGHVWEAVTAPGFSLLDDGRATLPD